MRWLQTEARAILKTGGAFCAEGLQKVRELNQICIRKNMSPGGAADLLAATIFLCRMETLDGTFEKYNNNKKYMTAVIDLNNSYRVGS